MTINGGRSNIHNDKGSGELSVLTAVKTFYPDFQNFILTNIKKYQYIPKNKER